MNNSIATGRLARPLVRRGFRAAVRRTFWILLICSVLASGLPSDGYIGSGYGELAINRAIGSQGFRLAAWEVQAWQEKVADAINRPDAGLSPAAQHDLVVAYFDAIDRIGELRGAIQRLYSDPQQLDANAAAAPLQAELDGLRATQQARRPAVERILQHQVAQVLRENGVLTANVLWPPVLFHFSESPDVLIISPRERIELEDSAILQPGAPVAQMERIEGRVESDLQVSALVEGTGGFSTYPTMVVEYADLEWVVNTIAHEWFHTYLAFHPLGWHYFDNSETRTLNETAASIFGDELGLQVLRRFYPERVPPPPAAPAARAAGSAAPAPARPEFSFAATMRATRLEVDRLLAEGRIADAEAFMEQQRQLIVSHGYVLRKLNQAYFAFHGSYAVGPSATDPIGDKLRALRERTPSLREFVALVRGITSVPELDALLGQAQS